MNHPDSNRACDLLGIRHPIIQGPFGGGLSTVNLTATVSRLGGLGSFGAHVLEPAQIGKLADDIRAQTSGSFAINLWLSDHDPGGMNLDTEAFDRAYRVFEPWFRELELARPEQPERYHPDSAQQIDALLEARPPVFSFVFGLPTPAVLAECKRRQITTVGAATSVAEAQALEGAGVQLIVATGSEAGGHRPSFLDRAEDVLTGTFALVQLIADRVRVPVIAAGGISDARGRRAAQALGAEAVQIGTAFLACDESGTHAAHRDALFGDQAFHTRLTRNFTGRLARGLRNGWTDHVALNADRLPPFPVTGWFVSQLRRAALVAKRDDLISLWGGQIAPNLRHRDATRLMNALIND